MSKMEIVSFRGDVPQKRFLLKNESESCVVEQCDKRVWRSPLLFLREAFLPAGFPHSVSDDYVQYQIFDSLQALCSSVTGQLAGRALMIGVGVGNIEATASSAIIQWIYRDGSSRIGHILFAWSQGTKLDVYCKTWRIMADIINDAALTMEWLSPLFPQYFTLIACSTGILKSIVGVAGGATRAALTQHQAKQNNMADVSAKDGSQETAVSLVGLLFSIGVISLIENEDHFSLLTISIFLLLTFFHILTNYLAVSSVVLHSLNPIRYSILLSNFIRSRDTPAVSPYLTQKEVAKRERILSFHSLTGIYPMSIRFGAPFEELAQDRDSIRRLLKKYSQERYLLSWQADQNRAIVILHTKAKPCDVLRAFFHAWVLSSCHQGTGPKELNIQDDLENELFRFVDRIFPDFLLSLGQRDWEVQNSALLSGEGWTADWDLENQKTE